MPRRKLQLHPNKREAKVGTLKPLSHGQHQSGSNADCKSRLDPDCVHMDDFVQLLYALCTCKQSISGKMVFEELLVIVLLFWLHSRRARRQRARIWRAAALRRVCYAVMETQRQMLLCASLAISWCLLQGTLVDRTLWIKHRSTGFIQDIVPGWHDQDFKGNFNVSRATFLYLVNELQSVLRK